MTETTTPTLTTTIVPENRRMNFLTTMFFNHLVGEQYAYKFADDYSSNYKGGYWEYVEVSNGARFMLPSGQAPVKVQVWGNHYEGEVSPEAFGIIVSFAAMALAINKTQDERIYDVYDLLREYVYEHPECREILKAID